MATLSWHAHDGIISAWEADDFFQCVRVLKRCSAQEIFFSSDKSMAFQAREMVSLKVLPDQIRMAVSFFHFIGARGRLPQEWSLLPFEFLDIFHHRFVEALYRSFECSHFYVNVEAGRRDTVIETLQALCGQANLPLHALRYAGYFAGQVRSSEGLARILKEYFTFPVGIYAFKGRWQALSLSQSSRLGVAHSALGRDTWMGQRFWDIESGFEIMIGPMSYSAFQGFLRGGEERLLLSYWLDIYLGGDYRCELTILVQQASIPKFYLGQPSRYLGWNIWLKDQDQEGCVEVSFRDKPRDSKECHSSQDENDGQK